MLQCPGNSKIKRVNIHARSVKLNMRNMAMFIFAFLEGVSMVLGVSDSQLPSMSCCNTVGFKNLEFRWNPKTAQMCCGKAGPNSKCDLKRSKSTCLPLVPLEYPFEKNRGRGRYYKKGWNLKCMPRPNPTFDMKRFMSLFVFDYHNRPASRRRHRLSAQNKMKFQDHPFWTGVQLEERLLSEGDEQGGADVSSKSAAAVAACVADVSSRWSSELLPLRSEKSRRAVVA
jgi:hypothetical protein